MTTVSAALSGIGGMSLKNRVTLMTPKVAPPRRITAAIAASEPKIQER